MKPPCNCNPSPNPYADIMNPASMPSYPVHPDIDFSHGIRKFAEVHDTPDHMFQAVRYRDGGTGLIAHGHIPGGHVTNNGPIFMPGNDSHGEISNSEGMDAPNFWFNNSDCGQNF